MGKKIKKVFSILFTLLGVSLLFYPWISNYINSHQADNKIDTYQAEVENTDDAERRRLYAEAKEYNQTLPDGQTRLVEPFEESVIDTRPFVYEKMLSLHGSEVMGVVSIPKIDVRLPIYHGTSTEVLEKGVGHLKGSSLPVGGIDTHVVLTGHTGLTNAKLFTDLTEMEKGDIFLLEVLNEKMAYKVTDIYIVLPEETDKLKIVRGKDLCTLVTCTPYGVNSHRLLVRAERTEYIEDDFNNAKRTNPLNSQWMKTYLIAVLVGVCLVLIILIVVYLIRRRKKGRVHVKNP